VTGVIRYETKTHIERPPKAVFEAVLDADLYDQWTEMTDTRFDAGPDGIGLGTRDRFRLPNSPFKGDLEVEVVEFEADRRVAFRVTHPSLTWIATAETQPEGTGTLFVYGGEMTLHGWRRLLEPMMKSEIVAGEAKEAERLKALLEAGARIAVPA
jgi:uncharacterized protein YndB with AHSA1/START domain